MRLGSHLLHAQVLVRNVCGPTCGTELSCALLRCSSLILCSAWMQLGPLVFCLSTAVFRKRLPRAPCLGGLGHASMHLELLLEGSQLPRNLRSFPFLLCTDFSEKGNEELSVPYSTSPADTGAARRGKWVIGSPWESAAWRRETGFACHHPGAEGNPGQKSRPFLDLLTSLLLGQSQREGCHGEGLSISV